MSDYSIDCCTSMPTLTLVIQTTNPRHSLDSSAKSKPHPDCSPETNQQTKNDRKRRLPEQEEAVHRATSNKTTLAGRLLIVYWSCATFTHLRCSCKSGVPQSIQNHSYIKYKTVKDKTDQRRHYLWVSFPHVDINEKKHEQKTMLRVSQAKNATL